MFKILFVFGLLSLVSSKSPLTVSIYYESLDNLSKIFLSGQFNTAIDTFGSSVNFELVPSGFAQVIYENAIWIRCPNGENECYGNGIAACALNQTLFFTPYAINHFVSCIENNTVDFDYIGQKCASAYHLDWRQINYCSTYLSNDLLVKTATITQNVGPTFLPYITFNHVKDDLVAGQAIADFQKSICDHMEKPTPEVCQ